MQVSEIVHVLSGEGIHAGLPTVLVRLTGCNLRCNYCDTKYAFVGGEARYIRDIVKEVRSYGSIGWVLVTGGEPLFQLGLDNALPTMLRTYGYEVEVETNGSIDPPMWFRCVDSWSVDVKCPSSGVCGTFRRSWLTRLRKRDQLKFVVGTEEDLDFVKGFATGNRCRAQFLVSPIMNLSMDLNDVQDELWYDARWLQRVAEFCKGQNLRMSLQMHKIIYGNREGV